MNEPGREGLSLGYLRKGSLVKIIERRSVNSRGNIEVWVFIDGTGQDSSEPGQSGRLPSGRLPSGWLPSGWLPSGWLNESAVDIYDNQAKALTASDVMIR
jgi:hypothetical protein